MARLQAGGIELIDFVDYQMLAGYYRRAVNVLVPCTIQGGGERSVLEGRACGALVHVAEDNPKLLQLAALPTVGTSIITVASCLTAWNVPAHRRRGV